MAREAQALPYQPTSTMAGGRCRSGHAVARPPVSPGGDPVMQCLPLAPSEALTEGH